MGGCALGDLVALAIRLSDAGLGDWWDDADAIVRNHLVEGQLVDAAALQRVAEASAGKEAPAFRPGEASRDRVIERSLGISARLSTPAGIPRPWSMLCCTGNGTQGLYYAWEAAVREDGDTARVNLPVNRASALLDVDSWLPYEGRVVVRTRGARRVSVRIPGRVERRSLRADVPGRPVRLDRAGNILVFDGLSPGDAVDLRFPVPLSTARFTVNANSDAEKACTCTFRGSTCVEVSPRDDAPTTYPLYRRGHLRGDRAPMKSVERFVPQRVVRDWWGESGVRWCGPRSGFQEFIGEGRQLLSIFLFERTLEPERLDLQIARGLPHAFRLQRGLHFFQANGPRIHVRGHEGITGLFSRRGEVPDELLDVRGKAEPARR